VRLPRDPRKTWTTAWIRAVAAFVAFLVAGDHGLASFHQALTAHDVCAEHGEFVHAASTHVEATLRGSGPGVEQGRAAEAHAGAASPVLGDRRDAAACLRRAFGVVRERDTRGGRSRPRSEAVAARLAPA